VTKLYALEPNPGMIRLAEQQRRRTKLEVEFLSLPGERIPLADGTVHTVVSTFTLGVIPGVAEALRGVRRVLMPGGRLLFIEHGLAPHPQVRRWQEWWEPIHHWVFEGLHLTRDIPSLITQGSFQIERMEAAYIAPFPKSWSYLCWGSAIPQSR
jgi:ubiquinone/menaquinone biosynthesis C-methylase UbiE